ncbi:MAG: D-alanine--D-alanine ligase [Caldilineaceae bacterium]|nr:D-alanine--D-alanine ligase [Caldilineaceae bacterium]
MQNQRSLRVGVLFGGRSGEHEVSLNSARNVMEALAKAGHIVVPIGITPQGHWLTSDNPLAQLTGAPTPPAQEALTLNGTRNGTEGDQDAWALLPHAQADTPLPTIDIIFPVLHGTYGEDGTVQGLLEMANLPYVGCGVLASAVAMDKAIAKQLFAQAGLRQAPYQVVLRRQWQTNPAAVIANLEATLTYPLFVKPANLGSSVGISKAHDRDALGPALDLASRYDRKLVVEQGIPNAREIEVSVLGNDEPQVSVVGEVVPANEFYDYAAKYLTDASELRIPAPVSPTIIRQVEEMARVAFRAADCAGLARVDFLLDDMSQTLYLNEINTMPGFTRHSMYPKLWEAAGIAYPELVDRLLQLALDQYNDRLQNSTTRT